MSCERFERALALDVSGDLPERDAQALRAHLESCASCRQVAARFERSQTALRGLADEDLPQDALRSVRTRVRTAIASESQQRLRLLPVWAWAAAASVVTLAIGFAAWRAMTARDVTDRSTAVTTATRRLAPTVALGTGDPSGLVQGGGPQDDDRRLVSAEPAGRPVVVARDRHPERALSFPRLAKDLASSRFLTDSNESRGQEIQATSLEAALQRAEPLSQEDADQLARALVYVSQLDRVPSVADEPSDAKDELKQSASLIRIATQDPNVVIYWQIDTNGG